MRKFATCFSLKHRGIAAFSCMLLLMLGVSLDLRSQDDTGGSGSFHYGVRAGLVSSGFYQQDFSRITHTGDISGFTLGGFASYDILDFLDVSAELLYLQQGGSRMAMINSLVDDSPVTTTAFTRLHNLEFNVLARLSLPGFADPLRPYFLLGPGLGYNITAVQQQDITYEYGGFSYTGSGSEQVRSDFRSLQYGLYLGLGSMFPAGSNMLSVDIRYRYGLNPINNGIDPFNRLGSVSDFSTHSWMLTIGYQIN